MYNIHGVILLVAYDLEDPNLARVYRYADHELLGYIRRESIGSVLVLKTGARFRYFTDALSNLLTY